MFAVADGLQQEGAGRFEAADKLNHDINFRIIKNIRHIPGQDRLLELFGELVELDIYHPGEHYPGADLAHQPFILVKKGLGQTAAYCAEADQAHFNNFHDFYELWLFEDKEQ